MPTGILFLDEPTSGLDVASTHLIREVITVRRRHGSVEARHCIVDPDQEAPGSGGRQSGQPQHLEHKHEDPVHTE